MDDSIQPGDLLNNRYRILKQLGGGNLSQTYLAKDSHRFNEACLLKEFILPSQVPELAEKILTLVEGQAQLLYRLHHPQIPQFRELFRLQQLNGEHLWIVLDYIPGPSYQELLNLYQSQARTFTEGEIQQLFRQILPVLDYLHCQGVIHGEIAPAHLILRTSDSLPVLIGLPTATLGEQISSESVSVERDISALAETALVLLRGKNTPSLSNPDNFPGDWKGEIALSSQFTQVLDKMLAKDFPSAQEVLAAVEQLPPEAAEVSLSQQEGEPAATVAALAPETDTSVPDFPMASTSSPPSNLFFGCLSKLVLVLGLALGAGMLGWFAGKTWLHHFTQADFNPLKTLPSSSSSQKTTAGIAQAELERKSALRSRRLNLGIDSQFYTNLVDELFWQKYPDRQGQALTSQPQDAQWRERWDAMGAEVLDKLSSLSPEALRGLGSYNQVNRDRWKQEANLLHLSSRSLYDLADAAFFFRFPEQQNRNFLEQPVGQVWDALVFDTLKNLQSGATYEQVTLAPGASAVQLRGTLPPGAGKAYVIHLDASLAMEIKLEANGGTLVSIYSPTGQNNLLEDSSSQGWSGILPETGFYEITIVSKAQTPLNYQLNLNLN
jgi:serine/threonine-protein kinase